MCRGYNRPWRCCWGIPLTLTSFHTICHPVLSLNVRKTTAPQDTVQYNARGPLPTSTPFSALGQWIQLPLKRLAVAPGEAVHLWTLERVRTLTLTAHGASGLRINHLTEDLTRAAPPAVDIWTLWSHRFETHAVVNAQSDGIGHRCEFEAATSIKAADWRARR